MKTRPDGRHATEAGCFCDFCVNKRRQHTRNNKLRELGKPQLVSQEEYQLARRKLRIFKAKGMSCVMMSDATGMSDSSITQIIAGLRFSRGEPVGTIRRSTFNTIMAMEYEEPPEDGKYTGARISPVGTRRRMQALAAVGFGFEFLGEQQGTGKAQPARLANPNHRLDFVTYQTYRRVKRMYEKLRYVDPLDMGVTPYCVARQVANSARKGYAPPSCWDDDAIDDPDAIAEWTGACGTMAGVRIHRKREIMPLCPACKAAQKADIESWRGTREEKTDEQQ